MILSSVKLVLVGCILGSTDHSVTANYFNPHVFPGVGPFFEGWYFRLTDFTHKISFGVLFGSVLPPSDRSPDHDDVPPAFVGLLRDNYNDPAGKLMAFDSFPLQKNIDIRVNGEPVTVDPYLDTPVNFAWSVRGGQGQGSVRAYPNETLILFHVGSVRFEAVVGPPVIWSTNGQGPELWLGFIPLPLHWFIYSVRSPIVSYSWTDLATGEHHSHGIEESSNHEFVALAHMEKNWGRGFPSASIWTQGYSPVTNVTYAFGFGPVDFGPTPINGHLGGYKNPKLGLDLTFMPINSFADVQVKGCEFKIRATIRGFWYKMDVDISAPHSTVSECLYAPQEDGFRATLVESYRATATVVISERSWYSTTYREIDEQIIEWSALEFNGYFVCDETPCTIGRPRERVHVDN